MKKNKIKVSAEQMRIIKTMSEHFNSAFENSDLGWCLALLHQNVVISQTDKAVVEMPERNDKIISKEE